MRLQIVAGVLALPSAAIALSDSTPWVLLSTSTLQDAVNHNQIQTISEVSQYTKDFLSTCPTDQYYIITQAGGVHAADLRRGNECAMPHLCRAADDDRIQGRYTVSEVLRKATDTDVQFAEHIKSVCAKKKKSVTVEEIVLASLGVENRANALSDNDAFLASKLEAAQSSSYTILLYSVPQEPAYEPEFLDLLHMDLKRDMQSVPNVPKKNETLRDTRPLFEKYQFFSPGIFMALIVALLLLSILYVGIKALSSLEVSYGAFEKEMGPAAQKKQS
ncbi:uncharacterized protein DCS_06273 [Drechmeria coniospora]|uniref:Protein BIG1 n=1 Tax=Drechmeria coniospora TaxID=98403 RepID=A0A151GB21_DRECN|nr:uncharacterized protein DCS_06273 [Drechmeria coniospora]KYK54316.1 uncharacterized protein DCS_06273 [Drechmeria coniospora]